MNPGDVVYQVSNGELVTGVVVVSPKGKMAVLYDHHPNNSPLVNSSLECWCADKEEFLYRCISPIIKENDRKIWEIRKLIEGSEPERPDSIDDRHRFPRPVSTFDARIVPDVVTGG